MYLAGEVLTIIACGMAGGAANVLVSDSGARLHGRISDVWNPGFVGALIAGAAAGFASWAASNDVALSAPLVLKFPDLANALLVGFGGSRWLTNEVDKRFLRAAAATAANKQSSASAGMQIAAASPIRTLEIAKQMV